MGRYYFGSIRGKFWFACQDSDDALHFGATTVECECEFEYDSDNSDSSSNEFECSLLHLEIHSDQIPDIQETLNELELQIGSDIINNLNITFDKESDFEYDIEDFDESDENKNELVARWCLGKQILEFFTVTESEYCYMLCEC